MAKMTKRLAVLVSEEFWDAAARGWVRRARDAEVEALRVLLPDHLERAFAGGGHTVAVVSSMAPVSLWGRGFDVEVER